VPEKVVGALLAVISFRAHTGGTSYMHCACSLVHSDGRRAASWFSGHALPIASGIPLVSTCCIHLFSMLTSNGVPAMEKLHGRI